MTKVECGDGMTLEYDETISVGDLITTYNSGYHILTKITFRDGVPAKTPLFQYVQVLSPKGKKKGGPPQECDASYCRKVTKGTVFKQLSQSIKAAYELSEALFEFIDNGEPK